MTIALTMMWQRATTHPDWERALEMAQDHLEGLDDPALVTLITALIDELSMRTQTPRVFVLHFLTALADR